MSGPFDIILYCSFSLIIFLSIMSATKSICFLVDGKHFKVFETQGTCESCKDCFLFYGQSKVLILYKDKLNMHSLENVP